MKQTQDRLPSFILIITAVDAERDAIVRGLLKAFPEEVCGEAEGPLRRVGRCIVVAGGVGPAAAAASTALAIAGGPELRCVISAGIGGGFPGAAPVGSVVAASEIVCADLGAETAQGFASVDELGFGSRSVPVSRERAEALAAALRASGLLAVAAPVLTLSTVTGSAETAAELQRRVPGAAAEAMEGYGVALAASMQGVEAMEIRAISNAVGPRDRDAWRIGDALAALERTAMILPEVLELK
ncbi:futalosine hydrolase [Paenibacillus pasadenensis]|uniref:futalosine hydrolase n=1 Tax=Paenibacillus pasadenensis TaxID=217090 RepID=UPI00203EEA7D|nr:futalosine hydrolase [Paenibacillus pasadenensis]